MCASHMAWLIESDDVAAAHDYLTHHDATWHNSYQPFGAHSHKAASHSATTSACIDCKERSDAALIALHSAYATRALRRNLIGDSHVSGDTWNKEMSPVALRM